MPKHKVDFGLYLITDRKQAKDGSLVDAVRQALQGGVKAVQLREKDLSTRELYELATEMRSITSAHGARLFINDRIDIALAVDADGVHLGGASLPVDKARMLMGEEKMIGVSCHNQISAHNAQDVGADFITFGPVFFTPSKASYGDPVGPGKLHEVADALLIPVFGLGGINRSNAPQVMKAGAAGIALISAILAADSPCREAELLMEMVSGKEPEDTEA